MPGPLVPGQRGECQGGPDRSPGPLPGDPGMTPLQQGLATNAVGAMSRRCGSLSGGPISGNPDADGGQPPPAVGPGSCRTGQWQVDAACHVRCSAQTPAHPVPTPGDDRVPWLFSWQTAGCAELRERTMGRSATPGTRQGARCRFLAMWPPIALGDLKRCFTITCNDPHPEDPHGPSPP